MEEDVDIPKPPPNTEQTLETGKDAYNTRWQQRLRGDPLVADKVKAKFAQLQGEADQALAEFKKSIP